MRTSGQSSATARRPWRRVAFSLIAASVATSLALALAGEARANHLNLSISVGKSAQLVAGVYIVLPVQITCPGDLSTGSFTFVYAEQVSVGVTQKTSGRTLAQGAGGFSFVDNSLFGQGSFGTPLTCDGSPHSYTLNVFPSVGTGLSPFHGGQAVVTGSVYIDLRDPSCGFCSSDVSTANLGPQTIAIRG
jgi:hypothetical protein